jgi:hypothetical protein
MMPAHPIGSSREAGSTAPEETTRTAAALDASESFAEFVTSVFQSWKAHGIAFLVLRNYDSLPHSTSNDIDVLILPHHFHDAERVMVNAAKQAGYVLHNRVRFATTAYFFYHPRSHRQVHVDLFSSLRWHCLPLLPPEAVVAARLHRDLYAIPNPLHEALISLFTSLVYTGQVKEKYRATIHAGLRSAPDVATRLLADAVGSRLASQCVQAAIGEQWHAVESLCWDLRAALIPRQVTRHPWNTLRAVVSDSLRFVERLVRPPGVTVAVLSVNPSLASAVSERLLVSLRDTFNPGRGWRRATARAPGIQSSMAAILQRRLALFRNGLVLIDGSACEVSTKEPSREHDMQQNESPRRLSRLAKTADCLFLLESAPNDSAARQAAVPASHPSGAESWHGEMAACPNAVVIDATQSAEHVAFEITRHVLHTMQTRASRRRLRTFADHVLRPAG